MAGWSGFTDEDLYRLKQENEEKDTTELQHSSKPNLIRKEKKRRGTINAKRLPTDSKQHGSKTDHQNANSNGKVNTNVSDANSQEKELKPNGRRDPNDGKKPEKEIRVIKNIPDKENMPSTKKEIIEGEGKREPDIRIISEEENAEIQMTELEKLQKRQKEIEEENKLKKKIITDTISERYKKAQHEASTLQTVQKELARLDCLLANDVEILRTKIEEATISYCHAQKRYEKAEKEFVNSKLDLKLKEERKEELTQHLYTIIQENELRKAKKLEELMSRLNLQENNLEEKLLSKKGDEKTIKESEENATTISN